MGQYWKLINLDKKEYVCPHDVGAGLKLGEMVNTSPGPGAAVLILCAAMPEPRGGGDFAEGQEAVGRWAGDRIALVGDYAEDADLPNSPVPASTIYDLCEPDAEGAWKDVSEMVCATIERECVGKFTGTGWREWQDEYGGGKTCLRPDGMIIVKGAAKNG